MACVCITHHRGQPQNRLLPSEEGRAPSCAEEAACTTLSASEPSPSLFGRRRLMALLSLRASSGNVHAVLHQQNYPLPAIGIGKLILAATEGFGPLLQTSLAGP